ncbi:hypothetical protein JI667_03815 [Bacillus sp. NTK074B]|uniref:hypothetical protein n=1 Tax=Bacillus sp. NTK074B TaxID=2802174 RepID=UPI001A8F550F|nr:hypothetical protein [Bacillus sp. NTK074B]
MGVRVDRSDVDGEPIIVHHPKKQLSMYSLLNLLGAFMMIGFGLMFFTVPLDVNEQLQWVYVKGILADGKLMREYFIFLFTMGFLYFTLLFLYFKRYWKKTSLLITLLCLGIMDVIFFFLTF